MLKQMSARNILETVRRAADDSDLRTIQVFKCCKEEASSATSELRTDRSNSILDVVSCFDDFVEEWKAFPLPASLYGA